MAALGRDWRPFKSSRFNTARAGTAYNPLMLDAMMPGGDGLSILKLLREKHYSIPVMLLTKRAEISGRVEGRILGADEYLSKPLAMSWKFTSNA